MFTFTGDKAVVYSLRRSLSHNVLFISYILTLLHPILLNNRIGDGQGFSKILHLKFVFILYKNSITIWQKIGESHIATVWQNLLPQPCFLFNDLFYSYFYLLSQKICTEKVKLFWKRMEVKISNLIGKVCSFKYEKIRQYLVSIWLRNRSLVLFCT